MTNTSEEETEFIIRRVSAELTRLREVTSSSWVASAEPADQEAGRVAESRQDIGSLGPVSQWTNSLPPTRKVS